MSFFHRGMGEGSARRGRPAVFGLRAAVLNGMNRGFSTPTSGVAKTANRWRR